MTKYVLALGLCLSLGCTSGEPDDGFLFEAPPPDEDVVRVVTPVYEIPPGDELFTCMTVPLENTEDLLIAETAAWQTSPQNETDSV